jgi:hypothetical protein
MMTEIKKNLEQQLLLLLFWTAALKERQLPVVYSRIDQTLNIYLVNSPFPT